MSRARFRFPLWVFFATSAWVLNPGQAWACAACFGKSDSALAQGMNMGILSLLAVITGVLCCVAGFFVFIARQGARAGTEVRAQEYVNSSTTQS